MRQMRFLWILLLAAGCASSHRAAVSDAPATVAVTVQADDFDALWAAAEDSARDLHFKPDLQDRRRGVLITEPLVGAQPMELLYRRELSTAEDVAASALGTYRRIVRFDVAEGDSGFVLTPTVQVQKYSLAERRVTDPLFYEDFFRRGDERGTPESDRGVYLPYRYWYDVGTDPALERRLADMVRRRL